MTHLHSNDRHLKSNINQFGALSEEKLKLLGTDTVANVRNEDKLATALSAAKESVPWNALCYVDCS